MFLTFLIGSFETGSYLTEKEFNIYFSNFDLDNYFELTHALMFELMFSSALSAAEICALKFSDINIKGKTLTIYIPKLKGYRLVPFGEVTLSLFIKYLGHPANSKLELRNLYKNPDSLFQEGNEPYTTENIKVILRYYLNKSNLNKNDDLEIFKTSFALHLLKNNTPLGNVLSLMGKFKKPAEDIIKTAQDLKKIESFQKFLSNI
ncbi:site-specific integrase [Leptospira weilii]|uniref:site-specific integrase n=1 Tax=Leptospira weilii TaxID=28184 RepID=UPI0030B8DF0C